MIESNPMPFSPMPFDSAGLVRHPEALGEGLSLATPSRVSRASYHRLPKGLDEDATLAETSFRQHSLRRHPGASLYRRSLAQLLRIESP